MAPDPDDDTLRQARAAQDDTDRRNAAQPPERWRDEAAEIARTQAEGVQRAEAMGDRVESSIPVPDPEDDPGAVQERSLGEARQRAAGRHDAEHG